ncbi:MULTISPECIES: DUF3455 domain-containing protein [unclassified Actinoplanes]|uniref:DUF3455 domain-containing protein n=1 Tax=unclassified Actinoplanes TaxID=2626549 RepID=UPI000C07B7D6|nr:MULTISPECIES: DUF3455 domain-containing protein [unclassified Actinoplanes]
MFSTKRSRIRALALTGSLAAAGVTIGAVTFDASAAETAAPAPVAADAAAAGGPAEAAAGAPAAAQLKAVPPLVTAVPKDIRPPDGSQPIGAFVVTAGTQNYTCVVPAGATTGGYTGNSVPEAQLLGTGGRIHHFAGPSWQSERDGSLVTATKTAALPPRAGAIPELLLQVKTHSGSGILDRADYINRLYTSGGVAPATGCTAGQTVSVPYKALYVFWDAPAA